MGLRNWLKKIFSRGTRKVRVGGRSAFTDHEKWVDTSDSATSEGRQDNLLSYGLRKEDQTGLEEWGIDFD